MENCHFVTINGGIDPLPQLSYTRDTFFSLSLYQNFLMLIKQKIEKRGAHAENIGMYKKE
jgi:hypothetical protein